jgi:undecaprenyl-diphosphatase
MNYLEVLLLALIQGAAELLPVSSSAHVILTAKLLGEKPSSPEFIFLLVMLHTGTMFAVLVYFWPRWKRILLPSASLDPTDRAPVALLHFLMMIVLATACTGVLGYGLKVFIEKAVLMGLLGHPKAEIEDLFESLPLMATSLFVVGVMIIVAGLRESKNGALVVTARSAVWIGLVQGLCLPFRGFSRSGATISTALYRGMDRRLAEDFSFALAVVLTPPVIGRGLYRLMNAPGWDDTIAVEMLLPGLVGMVFSFAAGLLALKVLSAALEKGRWKYFGYYCIFAALVVLTAAWVGY